MVLEQVDMYRKKKNPIIHFTHTMHTSKIKIDSDLNGKS